MGIPRPNLRQHIGLASQTRDIAGLLDHMYEQWGPIVDVGYRFPLSMVYLFGPEANRLILHERPENFLWGDALSTLIPVNGPTALVVTDGVDHARRRRLVQPAFAKRRVDANLDPIVEEADRMLESWHPGRKVNAWAEGRTAIRRIVVRALFGARLGHQADHIGELLEPALKYVNSNPATRVDVNLRFNGFARAARARRAVDEIVQNEIDRRRSVVDEGENADILSALLAASEDDDHLTDAEIRDQVRSLIAAGYDTTAAALSWLIYSLGANHSAMTSMTEQVRDLLGNRPPTIDDLRQLSIVDGVVRETLRLWPPGTVSLRTAIEPFDCYGHRIEAGRMVVYSPYVTHRMESVWDDPLSFRPERWVDGEPAPYSYVPFGGGGRNCLGFALATLELQIFAIRLVQHCTWTVDGDEPRSAAVASFAPAGGVPITIT